MSTYETMLTKIWDDYAGLTLYELMFKVNYALLKGEEIKHEDREYIVKRFLDGIDNEETIKRFHRGVHASASENRNMYPTFYIPPYDQGRKYVTISTVTPHTHILSANAYELEILRLLAIFAGNNEDVKQMLEKTKRRLQTTCYGNFCETGECFETSIIVLRFIGTVFSEEIQWMQKMIDGINRHLFEKKRHSGVNFYYWLALSELPINIAKPTIEGFSINLQKLIRRSFVMNSNHDKYASPFCYYALRNCLARLEEFAYIKDRKPYISEKDGRFHFNIDNIIGLGDR
jgi:hypothetical protein